MPLDFHIDSDLDSSWNEVGDITRVEGVEQIEQSIVISVFENVDMNAPPPQSEEIEQQRGAIEQAIRNNPHTREPVDVIVDEVDLAEKSISYVATTGRVRVDLNAD